MAVKSYIPHPALRPYVQGYVHTTFDIHDPSQPLDQHPIGHCALAFVLNEQQIIKELKSFFGYSPAKAHLSSQNLAQTVSSGI